MQLIQIRPLLQEDSEAINGLRRAKGVQENILSLPTETLSQTESFLNNLSEKDHMLVAEIEENKGKKVVGMVGLHLNSIPRIKHAAELVVMVDPRYQNKNIGRQLLEAILQVADQWLRIVRIQLEVFVDNQAAIYLYQSVGFVIEGTCKYAFIREGAYQHTYLMARYQESFL